MQEIIVYRNPLEKAMWDAASSGDFMPVIFGIGTFVIIFLMLDRIASPLSRILQKKFHYPYYKVLNIMTRINLLISAVIGCFIIWKTWI